MKNIISVIIVLVLGALAIFGYFQYAKPQTGGEASVRKPIIVNTQKGKVPAREQGTEEITYAAYSEDAIPEGKAYVVFFYADGCPDCVKADQEITDSKNKFPAKGVILKADYDTETELKEQYGVISQNTAVMINADGSVSDVKSGFKLQELKDFFGASVAFAEPEKEEIAVEPEEEPLVISDIAYVDYSKDAVPQGGKYAVFFYTDGSSTYIQEDKNIKEAAAGFPPGSVILKANYDKESALKKEYGVTKQDTAVMINADGSVAEVKEGFTIEDLKAFFAQ